MTPADLAGVSHEQLDREWLEAVERGDARDDRLHRARPPAGEAVILAEFDELVRDGEARWLDEEGEV